MSMSHMSLDLMHEAIMLPFRHPKTGGVTSSDGDLTADLEHSCFSHAVLYTVGSCPSSSCQGHWVSSSTSTVDISPSCSSTLLGL